MIVEEEDKNDIEEDLKELPYWARIQRFLMDRKIQKDRKD
jgi:hypothetical protein